MSRLDRFRLSGGLEELEGTVDPRLANQWPHRGLTTGFPLLTQALDGYRNHLYVAAGGSRMGKTTLLLQHAYDFLRFSPEARVVFVGLDQPRRDMFVKLVAMAGQCSADYLVNPTPDREEKYEKKKQRGLARIQEIKDRLWLVDEGDGAIRLEDLAELTSELRAGAEGPLFLVIDPLFKLRCREVPFSAPLGERVAYLAGELKTLCLQQRVGVLLSTRLDTGSGRSRPVLADLEGQSALLYEAAAVLLLYNDAANDAQSPFLEWEWGSDDTMVPVIEMLVAKNKMGAFSGRLFYRFYQSLSMFRECSRLETENFNRMLENLERHSEDGPDKKDVPMQVVEDVSAT